MEKRIAITSILASITFALILTNAVANAQLLVAGIAAVVRISTIVFAIVAISLAYNRSLLQISK